jgi:hypothetical protein
MEKFEPIDIDFVINSAEVKANTEKVKKDIKSVGQTAEQSRAKIEAQIRAAYPASKLKNANIDESNKKLKEQRRILSGVSDKYKGLLDEGLATFGNLTKQQKSLVFQYNDHIDAISKVKLAQTDLNNRFDRGRINAVKYMKSQAALSTQNAKLQADLRGVKLELSKTGLEMEKQSTSMTKHNKVWRQFVKGLGMALALSIIITLFATYGKVLGEWIGKVLKGKNAFDEFKQSISAVNKAFASSTFKGAIKDMAELRSYVNLAKDGFIDKDVALKKYNDTLGKVYKKTNDIVEAERNLIEKAPAYIKSMLYKTAAAEANAEAAKQIAENAKRQFEIEEERAKADSNFKTASEAAQINKYSKNDASARQAAAFALRAKEAKDDLDDLDKEAEELQNKSSKVIDNLNKKAVEIAKAAGLDIFGLGDEDKSKVVDSYQKLLDKLSALDKEYTRKTFTKDEEEQQALKDKFETIRTLVQRFNADPKNKAQIIDLSNLDKLEVRATESLTYRQTTENLKGELVEQKKLFDEFETYKKQFGLAAAETEFKGKIGEAKTYYDYLKSQEKANAKAYENVANGTATGGEIERVEYLNKALKKATAEEKKLFDEQLAQLLDYQKKRALLIEKYETKRIKLLKAFKISEVAELDRQHKEELNSLDDTNIKKLRSYKALFKGIVGLTTKESKIVIDQAKALLKTLDMSADLKAAILKKIAEVEKILNESKLDNIYKYAQAADDLGKALNELGTGVGSSDLANLGSMLSGLSSGMGDILTVFDAAGGKDWSDLSAGAKTDVITAGISGVITLISVFASAAQKRKEAEEAYYLSVIGFQNEYNLSLQEQIRLRSILDENVFLKDYEGRVKDALASLQGANEEYQVSLNNLIDRGKVKVGLRNANDWGNIGTAAGAGAAVGAAVGSIVPVIGTLVGAIGGALIGAIGGLFGGKKKKDVYTDILKEYPELIEQTESGLLKINKALAESLLSNELVNKETAQILENILAWEEALEEARKQIKEVISELTGSLGSDLKTVLVDAFVSGENAAIKMGDTVEKVLENIISSLIFNAVFSKAFDDLEEQMAESFDLGGDGTWIDDFSRFFNSASGLTDDFNTAMEAAQAEAANFGFDVFKPENSANQGLQGAIRRELTEETGSELTGLFRNQYDVTKRMLESAETYYEIEKKHHNSVLNLIAINTKIADNTFNTVEQLKKAVFQLEDIATNTREHYYLDGGT